jgi:hypothetical protein
LLKGIRRTKEWQFLVEYLKRAMVQGYCSYAEPVFLFDAFPGNEADHTAFEGKNLVGMRSALKKGQE